MITYMSNGLLEVNVFLDKKYVGDIKPVKGGYAYFPKGCKVSGDTFSTIAGVKKSLEED